MKKEHIVKARAAHHAALAALFPRANCTPLQLWRRLRRIEARANRYATDACNGTEVPEGWPAGIRDAIERQCGSIPDAFFINGDPRGYALKVAHPNPPEGLHRDWGGYGILAPEIN
jgi:hypothetical protein